MVVRGFDLPSNGDSWTDGVDGNEGDGEVGGTATTEKPKLASLDPPDTLIYVCEGTADYPLAYCEFPFSTLAGNEYTNSCADLVEDNPDVSVDRPWCFVSATDWGFCDCQAQLSFHAITVTTGSKVQLTVQATLDHPGTVWCSLTAPVDPLPALNSTYVGASGQVTDVMILSSISATFSFTVDVAVTKTKNYLACQALVPGIAIQPKSVGYILGSTPTDAPTTEEETSIKLITVTNGATIYSLMILVVLGSFIGTRYALDLRKLMLLEVSN